MEELLNMKCEACRKGAPKATGKEIEGFLPQIPEWRIVERENIKQLERTFNFKNFKQALSFTNHVGMLAEDENHHPVLVTR